jgi:hydroxymethylbilane synthase
MTTDGDRFLSQPLSTIGGKGLFVKEIEQALLDGRADLAVHSLKDMTSFMPEGLMLAAVPTREDPRDAFCSPAGLTLATLPQGARVGTSSLRRSCALRSRRPDLEIVSLRGNVQTRLNRTRELGLAGTMLAYAGLKRLGLEAAVTEVLPTHVSLPAVGQGVLAIQCRSEDAEVRALLAPLDDALTRVAVTAERALLARLEGGCTVPLAGHATVTDGTVHLRGFVGRPDGSRLVEGEVRGPADRAHLLGEALADDLLNRGAADILRDFGRAQGGRQ